VRNFSFVSFGQPVAKGRPRVTMRGTYTPKKTKDAEQRIGLDFIAAAAKQRAEISFPIVMPLRVICRCYFQMPRRPKNKAWHITKPDADNCGKLMGDALNGLAWIDDSQIVDLQITKQYICDAITQPQMQIEIHVLGENHD
jgi:Holliday junction resolvase RusA-like endonuclease